MDYMFIALICGILGLGFALFSVFYVLKQSEGTDRMKEISKAIKEGAEAFLRREYQILAVFVVAVTIILAFVLRWETAVSFLFGAVCSMGAGYAGMSIAVRSNSRTAAAASQSLNQGLRVSFRAGAVMGMAVVGVGIIGLSILYFAFNGLPAGEFVEIIPAFGFGASGVALFSRVGGGIYTKAADTGADLVGKVEQGIPEDDPRNAAVIADFVGDNVGDVAGMGADLFESYVESIIATMALFTVAVPWLASDSTTAWLLPMMVAAGGIAASIIGALLVRVGETPKMEALLGALRRGTFAAAILTAIFSFLVVRFLAESLDPFWAVLAGLVAGVLIGESTSYFTSFSYGPTKAISRASVSGAGANIVNGFANTDCDGFAAVLCRGSRYSSDRYERRQHWRCRPACSRGGHRDEPLERLDDCRAVSGRHAARGFLRPHAYRGRQDHESDRRGSSPPVPRNQRDHGRHRQARIRQVR
jgi:K(+)-stimulated pyrophosphate-energized sodium pump